MKNRLWKYCLILSLFVALAFQLVFSALHESQTVDEGVHLASGYSYWKTGDYRMNPEHPPLVKLMASVPLFWLNLHQPTSLPGWTSLDQWSFARELLYQTDTGPTTLFFLGRIPVMLLTLGLGLLLFLWSRRAWGFWGGALSLALFSFDPNILAHGHYVTTDLGLALFMALSVYFFERLFATGKKRDVFLFALSVALAHATKFSAVLLWPILLFLFIHRRAAQPTSTKRINMIFVMSTVVTVCLLTIALAYQFQPTHYTDGFIDVYWHNFWGHSAYLLGETSSTGWWWYFPVAFFVKTPLATLLIFLLSFIVFVRAFGKTFFAEPHFRLLLPSLMYFGASMTSSVNLGLRHVLPIYPFLFVFAGILTRVNLKRFTNGFRAVVLALVGILVITSSLAAPYYITYFSEGIGGTRHGDNYLVDSNLDWGQGLQELGKEVKERGITELGIVYFGQTPLEAYLPDVQFQRVPQSDSQEAQRAYHGWIAISVTVLRSEPAYAWLRDITPTVRIANSIFLYRR